MIFVWIGRLFASALILFGLLRIAMGYYVASGFPDQHDYEAASRRYLGSGTSGEAIDQGLTYLALGLAAAFLVRLIAKRRR